MNHSIGRFDILMARPGESIVLARPGDLDRDGGFLGELDAAFETEKIDVVKTDIPFHGGWFVYLGYELAAEIEPTLQVHADPLLPVAFAVRCRGGIIRDHIKGQCFVFSEGGAPDAVDCMLADIETCASDTYAADAGCHDILNASSMFSSELGGMHVREDDGVVFIDAVEEAREFIAAGHIYQANLSRNWHVEFDEPVRGADLYARLRDANPAPFSGLARWGETSIVSSSPERLLQVQNHIASTRPIAGTRPRSASEALDQRLSEELFAHPKERAEHIMLVDLERNDLGRVCVPGSVIVDEMMVRESYQHVHHIVSNVRGKLRQGVSPGEAIAAVFPGGTITGCPKVRCMQIISKLEQVARGPYTGSMGYLNRDGSMDLNILIRTMLHHGNSVSFRAGAGIVADSIPVAELAETRAKAKGMLRAVTDGTDTNSEND